MKTSLIAILFYLSILPLFSQEIYDGVFRFKLLQNNTLSVISIMNNGYDTIKIPETVKYNGEFLNVSAIDSKALSNGYSCEPYDQEQWFRKNVYRHYLITVIIPKNVKIISDGILISKEEYNREHIPSVNLIIPEKLNYIDDNAFALHCRSNYYNGCNYTEKIPLKTITIYTDSTKISISDTNNDSIPESNDLNNEEFALFNRLVRFYNTNTNVDFREYKYLTFSYNNKKTLIPQSKYDILIKENLKFNSFSDKNNINFVRDHSQLYNLDSHLYKVYSLLSNNIWNYNPEWYSKYPTELNKSIFIKSEEYKANDSIFKNHRKYFQNKVSYIEWKPKSISDYDINKKCFTINAFHEEKVEDYANVIRAKYPIKTFFSLRSAESVCLPAIPIVVNKKLKRWENYGGNIFYYNDVDGYFQIYIDQSTALEMESKKGDLRIFFVFPDNVKIGRLSVDKVSIWSNTLSNKIEDYLVAYKVRMIITNKSLDKIYYDKLYNYTPATTQTNKSKKK